MAIDLRSDTVTLPSEAMMDAVASASLGDDVLGDDPTVGELERTTAHVLGKEDALFVPSGSMANTIAMGVLAGAPGSEVLLHEGAHIFNYEGGAASTLWGLTIRPLAGTDGKFQPADVHAAASRGENDHFPRIRAVAVENTHNRAGGTFWSQAEIEQVAQAARKWNLRVHIDGARLWNAAVAGAGTVKGLAAPADTVSVCFSKGLGAPVGSALAGDKALIYEARRLRKLLGGGMRQSGLVAAAALYALNHNRERLAEDHHRASRLAKAAAKIPGVKVLPAPTNIVIVDVGDLGLTQEKVVSDFLEYGIKVIGFGAARFRMVTHLDLTDDDIDTAAKAIEKVLGGTH